MMLSLIVAIAILLIIGRSARADLALILGVGKLPSRAARVNWMLVGLCITLMLLVVIAPEARIFLLFIDAVGLDFFLLLLACQFRELSWILRDNVLAPVWRGLMGWVPFPLDLPTPQVVREFPYLSGCALFGVVASVSFALICSLAVVLPMMALVRS
jgi:hypothetical protein